MTKKLWIGIGILAVLTPLGILAKGSAWGEWGSEELLRRLGYIPEGLRKLESLWKAALADYALPGWDTSWKAFLGYFLCAILGIGVVFMVSLLLGKYLACNNKDKPHDP